MAWNEAGIPVEDRFWARVNRVEGGCWNWTGHVSGGYGRIRRPSGRRMQAHRFSYELLTGLVIEDGLHLDHLCRNQLCVNPAHLEPVTPRENLKRGMAPSMVTAREEVCVNGHPFIPETVYVRPNGKRECRECIANYRREYRARNSSRINGTKRKAYAEKVGGSHRW